MRLVLYIFCGVWACGDTFFVTYLPCGYTFSVTYGACGDTVSVAYGACSPTFFVNIIRIASTSVPNLVSWCLIMRARVM